MSQSQAGADRAPLTVVIPTLNERVDLPGCLSTVRWADEKLVVDVGSGDDTVIVARRAGARVIESDRIGIARQRNLGISMARHRWVLMLDADERVSPELADEVRGVIAGRPGAVAYAIRRRSFFLGREIRHGGWGSDWVVRLFRSELRYHDREVHETLDYGGSCPRLRATLEHVPYRDVEELHEKADCYAELAGRELRDLSRLRKIWRLLTHPPARWLLKYLAQAGFLDGRRGLTLASVAARGVFRKYRWALRPH